MSKCLHGGLTVLLLVLACGCRTDAPPPQEPMALASVHPGINDPYTQEVVDVARWVARFESPDREVFQQRERIVRELRLLKGATVADVGAGTGAFTTLLAEEVGPEGRVYATDIVPEFLLHIRQRAAQVGATNVETVLSSERSVGLPPNSTDLAFLCDVYHHFEYPQQTLASLHQALRLGGELVIIDFRRVEGESSDWVMEHVRAGQEQVTREIEAAGFRKVGELPFLQMNYFLRFRKREI